MEADNDMPPERKNLDQRNKMTELERIRHSCAHVMATAIARLWPAGTLWAAFVRSPEAHAKIVSVDTSAAKERPGIHAVFTGDDLSVFVERLVEIAHAEQQDRVRVLPLEALVLLPDRRSVHPCSCRH